MGLYYGELRFKFLELAPKRAGWELEAGAQVVARPWQFTGEDGAGASFGVAFGHEFTHLIL